MNETTRRLIDTPLTAEEAAWIESKKAPVKDADRLTAVEPRFGKVMSRYTLPRNTTKGVR